MHVITPAMAAAACSAACRHRHTPKPSSPAADYSAAVARAQLRQAQDDSVVAPGGRSILMGHGERTARVFVLLHGFTDSPKQFESLGQRLFATGDNVYIPRLPHHAEAQGRMRSLTRITASELAAFGDSTIDIARGLGDSIIVVGLSAGGNVAASIRSNIATRRVARGAHRTGNRCWSRLRRRGARTHDRCVAPPERDAKRSTRQRASRLHPGHHDARTCAASPAARRRDPRRGRRFSGRRASNHVLTERERSHRERRGVVGSGARRWTEGPSLVSVYQFPGALRLPHNVMETTARGGNLELVLPVVEAMARGAQMPTTAPFRFFVSDWEAALASALAPRR